MVYEPALVLLLVASTLVDYFCALKIYSAKTQQIKKIFAGTSIAVNVGILIAFKYLFFFSASLASILAYFGIVIPIDEAEQSYHISQILLPVGISFYTFQTMSYTIDVYRGRIKPEKHLGVFALYVAYFPQLVAGPIERASRLLPQLKKKVAINLKNIEQGLIMMAWGFFLKIVVADRLGIYVDEAFANPESPHGFSLILGAFLFCFQIYYDFSAYTTIAIGIAKVLGVDLIQNFNRPIFFTSSADFWKRWHISLMQWMRDYVYRPLVVNLKLKRVPAVLIVFFVVGLWHGANWTFVVWSMLNALLLIAEVSTNTFRSRLFKKLQIPKKIISFLGWFFVFCYLTITLVFFRSSSITTALVYLENMCNLGSLHINILNNYLELFLCLIFIGIVQLIHYYKGNNKVYELVLEQPKHYKWIAYFGYIIIIVLFGINRQSSFIYFQF
ncbi:MBOAT family protein [Cellulophaga sp. F20128]|nr:MBOAT family protein [Cellulophaga sp. F20128]